MTYAMTDAMTNSTPRFFDPAPLLPYLADGWRIVTPNSRLASRVQLSIVTACHSSSAGPVAAPAVMSLKHWYDACWQQRLLAADEFALSHRVLTDTQESLLWQQIVAETTLDNAYVLLNTTAAADDLMRARQWLWQWQINPFDNTHRSYFVSEEQQAALTWISAFDERCANRQWLTREARNSYLADCASTITLSEQPVLLLGFAEMTPRDKRVMQSLSRCEIFSLPEKAARRELLTFDSADTELLTAAHWIKHQSQTGKRVALVVPDLTARRNEIVRVLQNVLEPAQQTIDQDWLLPPFNISAGEKLAALPIARTAILALRLVYTRLSRAEWQSLFVSPYFSLLSDDPAAVAALIHTLADTRSDNLEASAIRKQFFSLVNRFDAIKSLHQILSGIAAGQKQGKSRAAASVWAQRFRDVLQVLQWPGRRKLHSIDFQQFNQCLKSLDAFAQTDLMATDIAVADAIQLFESILQQQVFQPQSGDARVQVLGTLEAAGLQFDAIWLLGMDEMQWPAAAAPNPYLPNALQRRYGLPRSSAQRELELAQSLTQQLLAGSDQIIASYCAIQDETPIEPSYLLHDFVSIEATDLSLDVKTRFDVISQSLSSVTIDCVDSGNAPPYLSGENARGGSAIISLQSQCPFRSFALHRLQADKPEPAGYVFDHREQGKLLHKALEIVWRDLPDQLALKVLSHDELLIHCEQAIDAALAALQSSLMKNGIVFGPVLQSLEKQRLLERLLVWFDVEKQRASFRVSQREEQQTLRLSELHLQMRADRIDELADGSLMIIDYKTGTADKPAHWLGDRPENLQLPLYAYALTPKASVSALALAKITVKETELDGFARDDEQRLKTSYQLKDKKNPALDWHVDSWDALLQHWQITIEKLADDFCHGHALVDPVKPKSTCTYCELKPLCRFHLQASDVLVVDDESIDAMTDAETETGDE